MQFFLDHLASIFIVSVVLLIMVLVQIRGTQSAAESTVNNIVYNDVMNMTSYLQRDLENMLTQDQATDAQASGLYPAGAVPLCTGLDTLTTGIHAANHTVSFRFPTLFDPDNPLTSQIVEVQYDLVNTGRTITLPTQDSTQTIPLFRLNRLVTGGPFVGTDVFSGSSDDIVTSFRIETLRRFDAYDEFARINGTCPTDLRKVRFEFKMAQGGLAFSPGDQTSTSQTNISRFGSTVNLSNWE